jgi:hypothetical protein
LDHFFGRSPSVIEWLGKHAEAPSPTGSSSLKSASKSATRTKKFSAGEQFSLVSVGKQLSPATCVRARWWRLRDLVWPLL